MKHPDSPARDSPLNELLRRKQRSIVRFIFVNTASGGESTRPAKGGIESGWISARKIESSTIVVNEEIDNPLPSVFF